MEGSFLVGGARVTRPETFQASDPATGALLEPEFSVSSAADVAEACALADEAFDSFRELAPDDRAAFLETVADEIEALGDALIERAHAESGLPLARLTGERGRTAGQLRLFARVVRDGYWVGASIDPAQPDRQPLPRSDLRLRRIPVGPVAVFGASNFPLAFSVAGGDTASAWAAGCPVVVKGHPAHPGTSVLVGQAIRRAVEVCGLHEGVFSLLQGASNSLGTSLVSNPRIRAVGFTGSRAGGLALMEIAATRPEPIPVFAEMSSVNPVILLPDALATRGAALGAAFVASLTMGSGQFCTNPGILLAVEGQGPDAFVEAAIAAIEAAQPQVMLTSAIHAHYDRGVAALEGHEAVRLLARGAVPSGCNRGQAALFETSGRAFLADAALGHEIFGAASLLVRCADQAELVSVLGAMEGQLTATLHIADGDHAAARDLLPLLERKVGRILANGWPTGVEVCDAMVHGGPFPATSDSRTTSVGATAIDRFLRPVCYQDLPQDVLPPALRDANPLSLPRARDGRPAA
jgi:NADP-dependent aldehyde dehydrogenase